MWYDDRRVFGNQLNGVGSMQVFWNAINHLLMAVHLEVRCDDRALLTGNARIAELTVDRKNAI